MKTWLAVAAGVGLITIGTGLAGARLAFVLGVALLSYQVSVLVSLAAYDALHQAGDLADIWVRWHPSGQAEGPWYGTAAQYRHGQGLVEYALILVLVALVVLVILSAIGPLVGNMFSNVLANI